MVRMNTGTEPPLTDCPLGRDSHVPISGAWAMTIGVGMGVGIGVGVGSGIGIDIGIGHWAGT